jgi:RNA polymerase sigma-70 factor (ECF subfamily)
MIDHYRMAGRDAPNVEPEKAEAALADDAELKGIVCACVDTLIPTLKPEYAEIIRRVDLMEEPLADW